MKEFLLIFRVDYNAMPKDSPEKLQAIATKRQAWLRSIASRNKLSAAGERLERDGKVIKPDLMVTDGPYVEMKEAIGGYTLIKARDLNEATELVKDCPVFDVGGFVEVRPVMELSNRQ